MKKLIASILIFTAVGFTAGWFVDSHRTVVKTVTKTETISLIAEEETCKKDGGDFTVIGTDVVTDWQAPKYVSLELTCSKEVTTTYFDIVIPTTHKIAR